MTPMKLTRRFIAIRGNWNYTDADVKWLQTVFGCILKVARTQREFTVDAIWEQIEKVQAKGNLPKSTLDHRILGPMIRHMVAEGLLGSTGYYTKSTRRGGGSRPVTIWESYLTTKVAA